jgi:hypothetical protein
MSQSRPQRVPGSGGKLRSPRENSFYYVSRLQLEVTWNTHTV